MAAAAGGIPSPAGDSGPSQALPPGAPGPPAMLGVEQKPRFVAPPTSTTRLGTSESVAVPLLTRPPLGSPPSSGPSPLFPPQASAGSLPRPQAGAAVPPHFPPPRLPTSTVGAAVMPPPPPPFPRPPPANGSSAQLPPPPLSASSPVPLSPSSHPPPHATPPGLQISPQRPQSFPPPPGLPPSAALPAALLGPPVGPPPISGSSFPPPAAPQNSAPPRFPANDLMGQPNMRPLAPVPPQLPLLNPPSTQPLPQFRPPPGPPPALSAPGLMPLPPHLQPPEQGGAPSGLQMPSPTLARFPPPTSQSSAVSSTGGESAGPHGLPSPTTTAPHQTLSSTTTTADAGPTLTSQSSPSPHTSAPTTPSPKDTTAPIILSAKQKGEAAALGGMETGNDEVWFEHKMPDGRVYFSHSITRKTTWDRPHNVVIKPHPAQQAPARSTFPAGPIPPGMPNAAHLVPTRVWSEFHTPEGKPYFYNKITRASVWERPTDFDLVMPLPPELGSPGAGPASHQQRMPLAHSPGALRPPLMSTPPMFPPGRPPFAPGFPPGHPAMNQGPPLHLEPRFPPPSHPGGGRPPPPPTSAAGASGGVTGEGANESNGDSTGELEVMEVDKTTQSDGEGGEGVSAVPTEPGSTAAGGGGEGEGEQDTGRGPLLTSEPEPVKEEPKGPRPIASVPVPGTPWSVVWTSDERQFFFDVTSRVSLWMVPEELKDNPQVEKIIENGPDGKAPSAKRVKLAEDGEDVVEEDEMTEEEGEGEGGGLDIAVGDQPAVVLVQPVQTDPMEAEKKAALIRSGKTLDERQEEFKEMLLERGVSAFSTWDKELPKFVFDPRYMLLNSKERKACFEEFIRSRAEEERKEKKNKLKASRDSFRKLLEDSKLHPKSSFSEFAQRHGRDERFKAVEKMREREQLFTEYLQELKKTASAGSARGRHKSIEIHSSSGHAKADKVKADFMEMLSEDKSLSKSSQWRKVKGTMERDARYRAVSGGSSQREEWFREYVKSLGASAGGGKTDPGREREERIQASLKEREREVQMSRSAQEKEWGRERDQLRRSEVLEQFTAMLADTIRNTGVAWNDARRQLKQDPRWGSTGLLEAEEKEKLYQEHCDRLMERKRLQFRRLLEETVQISLVMPWKKARKLIRDDPRYKNFTESDHRREVEYDKYLRDKMVTAKNEFRSLLKETKIITYKSRDLVRESDKHHKEIIHLLEKDQRYLVLECVEDERRRILEDYMAELHRKGPPPPPTASNPSERLRKT